MFSLFSWSWPSEDSTLKHHHQPHTPQGCCWVKQVHTPSPFCWAHFPWFWTKTGLLQKSQQWTQSMFFLSSLFAVRMRPARSTPQPPLAPTLSAIRWDLDPLKALLWGWSMTVTVQLMWVMTVSRWERRERSESHNCPCEKRKTNGEIWEIAGSSLLAKQIDINLCVKTDGKPWGGSSAKTLWRRIFRSRIFCYYAGKLLLLTLPRTVLVFDTQNRSLRAWSCTM